MFQAGKYPYALFMGHLALEKLLKALVVKTTQRHAPFTHSLTLLSSLLSINITRETQDKLARFMEFHIEARYPEEQKTFYKKCSKEFADDKTKEIKGVFTWLKERL